MVRKGSSGGKQYYSKGDGTKTVVKGGRIIGNLPSGRATAPVSGEDIGTVAQNSKADDDRATLDSVSIAYRAYQEKPEVDSTWVEMQRHLAETTGDPDVLDTLANFEHPMVRKQVAKNPGTSSATLDRLATDEDIDVVVQAAQSIGLSPATHARLLGDERAVVQKAATLNRKHYAEKTGVEALAVLRAEVSAIRAAPGKDLRNLVFQNISRDVAMRARAGIMRGDDESGVAVILEMRDMDSARAILDPASELHPVRGEPTALTFRTSPSEDNVVAQRVFNRREQLVAMLATSGDPRDRLTAAATTQSTQQLKTFQGDPDERVRQMAAENMRNTVGSPMKRMRKSIGKWLNVDGPEALRQ